MLTLVWFLMVAAVLGLAGLCRTTSHTLSISWFDILPHLRPSKKARGRGQDRSHS